MDATANPPASSSVSPTSVISHREALARMRGEAAPLRVQGPLSRPQILDATEASLREDGYDGTTIRRIASRLDCAVGSIYRYFTDKRALLTAVTQRRFEPVAEQVEAGAPIAQTAALYHRLANEEPQQYRLMFWLASVGRPDRPRLPDVIERILAGWTRQLGDRAEAEAYWVQLHGRLMLGRTTAPPTPVRAAASSVASGVAASPPHAGIAPTTPTTPHPRVAMSEPSRTSVPAPSPAVEHDGEASLAASPSTGRDDLTLL